MESGNTHARLIWKSFEREEVVVFVGRLLAETSRTCRNPPSWPPKCQASRISRVIHSTRIHAYIFPESGNFQDDKKAHERGKTEKLRYASISQDRDQQDGMGDSGAISNADSGWFRCLRSSLVRKYYIIDEKIIIQLKHKLILLTALFLILMQDISSFFLQWNEKTNSIYACANNFVSHGMQINTYKLMYYWWNKRIPWDYSSKYSASLDSNSGQTSNPAESILKNA